MAKKEVSESIGIRKQENFLEWFRRVIKLTDMVETRYPIKGFIVRKPWTMRIVNQVYRIYHEELDERDHEPAMFPLLIPESNLNKEKDHVEGFSAEVFWVTEGGSKKNKKFEERYALKPTGETCIYPMYSLWVRSWQDLPIKMYHSGNVFRYETKETRPFLREREFMWIETHCVFSTHDEALKQVKQDIEISKKVLRERLALPFMIFKRPQWDKFAGAVNTFGVDIILEDGRVNQIGSTHDLGQNFSKAFDIKFVDKDEKEKYAWQTCYGPGFSRIIAGIVGVHGDDRGLRFPFEIAPLHVIIVPIFFKDSKEKVMEHCEKIKKSLKSKGYRIKIDDREGSPGSKFYYWELRGVPIRLEIGPRDIENKSLVVYRRDLDKKEVVKEKDLIKVLEKAPSEILDNLRSESEEILNKVVVDSFEFNDLVDKINSGKIVRTNFCSTDFDGEKCADRISEETSAEVRGENSEKEEKPEKGAKCVVCGKEAKHVVYVAKAY